jgi:hypothetical protein
LERLLSRFLRFLHLAAPGAALLAAACGGSPEYTPPPESMAALCAFDRETTENLVVTHHKFTGALLAGDIDRAEYWEQGFTSIASAMAAPKKEFYETEVRQDCYNQTGNYYFPCRVRVSIDLRSARGLARSNNLTEADQTAILNCGQITTRRVSEALESRRFLSGELECEVVENGYCPIPPP